MFNLFNKKEKEEEDEKEEISQKKSSKKRTKKEPPKPWGKKERLWVGGVLTFTVLLSVILAMQAREWKLPNLPRINLSPNIFEGEKIVLEADGGAARSEALIRSEKITTDFANTTKKLSGVWGLYIYDIENDFSFGVNQDEEFQAASLIKLPMITMLYEKQEAGEVDFESIHLLEAGDKLVGAGSLYSKPVGTKVSYGEIAYLMANESDNTAFRIALNLFGEQDFDTYLAEIGMSSTSYDTNTTTPADIGRLFKKLYTGKIVSTQNRQKIFESLTDTAFEEHLPAGIPDQVQVAHKYGREVHVVNDAGVVFSDNPYIVVIMSKGVVESEADGAFPGLSKAIFEEFEFQSLNL